MDLQDIDLLMQQGEYEQILHKISNIKQELLIDGQIFKIRVLTKMGRLKEAQLLSSQLSQETERPKTLLQKLQLAINYSYCLLHLMYLPQMSEVLQTAEKLYSQLELTPSFDGRKYQGSLWYLRGYLTFYQGNVPQSLETLQKSLSIRELLNNQQDIAETAIAIGWIHLDDTGELDLAFKFIERSLELSQALGNKSDIAFSLHRLANFYSEKENFDKSIHLMRRSLKLYQDLNNQLEIARLLHNIGYLLFSNEEYEEALEYIHKSLSFYDQLKNLDGIGFCYNMLSWIYNAQGDFDLAIDFKKKGLAISEQLGRQLVSAFHLMNIGYVLQWGKGDLPLAQEYLEKGLRKHQECGSDKGFALNLIHLSRNHFLQGETALALEILENALQISIRIDNQLYQGICLIYKGIIHKLSGKYELAETHLTTGCEIFSQIEGGGKGLSSWHSLGLFHLITIAQISLNYKKAETYLQELKRISDQSRRKLNHLRYRFAKALVKTMSKRAIDKFEAQRIFQAIVDEEVIDHSISTLAMFNLCELLILELKISESEEEILNEVTLLSDKLALIASQQSSSQLQIMSLILKSKLALVTGDFQEASKCLDQAHDLAHKKSLFILFTQVKTEQRYLHSELEKWEGLIRRNASIKERIEQARVESYLLEAKKIQEAWLQPSSDSLS